MTHKELKQRNEAMYTRFIQLSEFYTKRERYTDIAESHALSAKQVQKIILTIKHERRSK